MHKEKLKTNFQPTPLDLYRERNALLQKTLRTSENEFSIQEEYPIVLSKELGQKFSYCLMHEDKIVCHANLWPRKIISPNQIDIGLIGNVATDPDFQKRGLMQELFIHIEKEAQNQGLKALVLWSDLQLFYQKLGFQSLSQEVRFHFNLSSLQDFPSGPAPFFLVESPSEESVDFESLLSLRPNCVTLNRSAKEFEKLLQIPSTHLFVLVDENKYLAYFVLGKGADMAGVIHEWGALSPKYLVQAAEHVLTLSGWPEVILLAPDNISKEFEENLNLFSLKKEKHPMALYKPLGEDQLRQLNPFIWGLDSI